MLKIPDVTHEHVESYQRNGAVLIKNVLDVADRERLERGVEEARRAEGRRSTRVPSPAGKGATIVRDYATLDSPDLEHFVRSGLVGHIGAKLMGTASAHLILDQIFYKEKGPILPTPWHQDTPFFRVRGMEVVRLWFPCDSSPRELTVQVVRGSHRWNVIYRATGELDRTAAKEADHALTDVGDLALPLVPDIRNYPASFDILRWDVEPGDVLAFQGNMLHGTDGHPGHDRPRRAFAVLMGGPDLRYHVPEGKAFPSPGKMRGLRERDDMLDGAPIGEFEDAFPICWPID